MEARVLSNENSRLLPCVARPSNSLITQPWNQGLIWTIPFVARRCIHRSDCFRQVVVDNSGRVGLGAHNYERLPMSPLPCL